MHTAFTAFPQARFIVCDGGMKQECYQFCIIEKFPDERSAEVLRNRQNPSSQLTAEEALVAKHGFHSFYQVLACIELHHIAAGIGAERLLHGFLGIHRAQKKYLDARSELMDLSRGIDAVQLRKPDVEQDHIRVEGPGLLHCFDSIGGFADDAPSELFGDDRDEKAPTCVVVCDQNANGRYLFSGSSRFTSGPVHGMRPKVSGLATGLIGQRVRKGPRAD
jgi:hypothetical protein